MFFKPFLAKFSLLALTLFSSSVLAQVPTLAQRQTAAASTATSTSNSCSRLPAFYWEIGNASGKQVSGVKGTGVTGTTVLDIASSSKMVYGAYVAQRGYTQADVPFMNFTAGYSDFGSCGWKTVAGCSTSGNNGISYPGHVGKFYYSGGHLQAHGAKNPTIANMRAAQLTTHVNSVIGTNFGFSYNSTQLAGGMAATSEGYGRFLSKIVKGDLKFKNVLGAHQVCTQPSTCSTALKSPISGRAWNYSFAHWVEADGDGSYSSAGAFGFYPWISKDKSTYGLVGRQAFGGTAASISCGEAIRKAWMTGKPV